MIKFRKDEIKKLYPSIEKAKKMLGWKPLVNINLGLKKILNIIKKFILKFKNQSLLIVIF